MRDRITSIHNESQSGVYVHLNPSHKLPDGMSAADAGALFDEAFAALAKVGIYPSEISHLGDGTQRVEMTRYEIERAARASERRSIADDLMRWAEGHQEREHYAATAALAIASNKVRKGGTPWP